MDTVTVDCDSARKLPMVLSPAGLAWFQVNAPIGLKVFRSFQLGKFHQIGTTEYYRQHFSMMYL